MICYFVLVFDENIYSKKLYTTMLRLYSKIWKNYDKNGVFDDQ